VSNTGITFFRIHRREVAKAKWKFTKAGEDWFCFAGLWRPMAAGGEAFTPFDRQQQIGAAARLVARDLTLDHSPDTLIATLAQALLREDAGFHAYQMFEAGVRQFREWGNCDQGQHILIAVARYLAAHFRLSARCCRRPI
jgi:hypothetical protein